MRVLSKEQEARDERYLVLRALVAQSKRRAAEAAVAYAKRVVKS
jgi:hypothetical protein